MRSVVRKWGNSLGIRLPKHLAMEVSLENNSEVEISVADGKIVITPEKPRRRYHLKQLLLKVTSGNIHKEAGFGKAEGREMW